MATSVLENVRLKIVFDAGIVDGRQLKTTKTVTQIKKTATADGLYGAATTLASLQNKPVLVVSKLDETTLRA
ncbi:MAG: hypothetical protein Q4G61_10380 [Tissierellia bacterium]|nr:hypothetical protein [Tissierellia bacterium]